MSMEKGTGDWVSPLFGWRLTKHFARNFVNITHHTLAADLGARENRCHGLILQVRQLAFREGESAPHLSECRESVGTRPSSCLLFYDISYWPSVSLVTRSPGNKTKGRTASLAIFCVMSLLLHIFPPSLRWGSRAPFPGGPTLMKDSPRCSQTYFGFQPLPFQIMVNPHGGIKSKTTA